MLLRVVDQAEVKRRYRVFVVIESRGIESLLLRGGVGVRKYKYIWCVLILRLLFGADKITCGREKVKKVEEGSVLRSRDGVQL